MKKEFKTLLELLENTAYRKSRAAQSRFGKSSHIADKKPREIYMEACSEIATELETFGFKYKKSDPSVNRKFEDYIFQVRFQSSHNNVAGEYVALWIHADVLSPRIKKWRATQKHSLRVNAGIAGGQIGNLRPSPSWLEWDLAKPGKRKAMIKDAIETTKTIAFPYFSQFENLPLFLEKLRTDFPPGMKIPDVIEFSLCFGTKELAVEAGRNYLMKNPKYVQEYREFLKKYRNDGLPKLPNMKFASQMAFLSVEHELKFL